MVVCARTVGEAVEAPEADRRQFVILSRSNLNWHLLSVSLDSVCSNTDTSAGVRLLTINVLCPASAKLSQN